MQAKRPTLAQKKLIGSKGLNPENWLVVSEDKTRIILIHRHSTKHRTIVKEDNDG